VSPFVVGSLLGAGYLLTSSKVNDKKATLQALQDELATLPAPKVEQHPNAALVLQREQRVSALTAALQSRLAWDRILREISAVLPADVWLTALSAQSPQSPAATAAPAAPSTTTTTPTSGASAAPLPAPVPATPMSITGYTYSQDAVARLLGRIALIPDLQDVKLLQSTQTTVLSRKVYSFSIQASIRTQVTG
jgi:Tfp pilus assembly protein PilN